MSNDNKCPCFLAHTDSYKLSEMEKKHDLFEEQHILSESKIHEQQKTEIAELKKKYVYLEDRYKESGGLKCLRDRGLIKEVLRDIGKEFINLIDDKIAHNTARLHETKAKEVVEKALEKLDSPKKPTEPEKELYELYLKDEKNGEFYFKKTTHPFTEYNNMVHRGIGLKLMPYNTEKELIEEFVEEKKELEKDLRNKWKALGYHVYVEKNNHIKSLNDTYQGYLMALYIWKMYRVDYYSKRSGRGG